MISNVMVLCRGAAGTAVRADLLVDKGGFIAAMLGALESVVAGTMVAVGTSLPKLVTAIMALIKRQPVLSAGNIIDRWESINGFTPSNLFRVSILPLVCVDCSGSNSDYQAY